MFRFTVRDVLWLTTVAAFGLLWFLERDGRVTTLERTRRTYQENESLKAEVRQLRVELMDLRRQHKRETLQRLGVTD